MYHWCLGAETPQRILKLTTHYWYIPFASRRVSENTLTRYNAVILNLKKTLDPCMVAIGRFFVQCFSFTLLTRLPVPHLRSQITPGSFVINGRVDII